MLSRSSGRFHDLDLITLPGLQALCIGDVYVGVSSRGRADGHLEAWAFLFRTPEEMTDSVLVTFEEWTEFLCEWTLPPPDPTRV